MTWRSARKLHDLIMLGHYLSDVDQLGSILEISEEAEALLGQRVCFSRPSASRDHQLLEEPLPDVAARAHLTCVRAR